MCTCYSCLSSLAVAIRDSVVQSLTARLSVSYRIYELTEILSVLLDFSLTVNAATLIFISGCGSAISSAKEGKSGFILFIIW